MEAPNLRIIDDDLWDAVQTRKKAYGGVRKHMARRPKHMFSGLVRCSCCGTSFTVKSKDQLGCAAHHRICRPLSGGAQLQAEANRERIQIGKKIGVLKRQIDNIVNAIADGVATSSMKSRLLELDPEKDRLEARLVEIEKSAKAIVLHLPRPMRMSGN